MTHAEHHPAHDRDSCTDQDMCNADPEGSTGCARCTALVMDQRDQLATALKWALLRIRVSNLGEGGIFAMAEETLNRAGVEL